MKHAKSIFVNHLTHQLSHAADSRYICTAARRYHKKTSEGSRIFPTVVLAGDTWLQHFSGLPTPPPLQPLQLLQLAPSPATSVTDVHCPQAGALCDGVSTLDHIRHSAESQSPRLPVPFCRPNLPTETDAFSPTHAHRLSI